MKRGQSVNRMNMKFFVYLSYRYFHVSGRYKAIAYEAGIITLLGLISLNYLTLLKLFGLTNPLPRLSDDPLKGRLMALIELLPFYFALTMIFKKKVVTALRYDEDSIIKGNRLLVLYVIGTFLLFVIVIVTKR